MIDDSVELNLARQVEPERALFVYYGGDDGLDNDGDGLIDENDEQNRLFFTAPLTDGAGNLLGPINVRVNIDAPNFPTALAVNGVPPNTTVTVSDVDVLDNDFDLVINNSREYVFEEPFDPVSGTTTYQPMREWSVDKRKLIDPITGRLYSNVFNDINPSYYGAIAGYTHSAPHVDGRAGVPGGGACGGAGGRRHAKANLNIVNGYAPHYGSPAGDGFNQDRMASGGSAAGPPITRNLDQGLDPSEWDARILPLSGSVKAGAWPRCGRARPTAWGFRSRRVAGRSWRWTRGSQLRPCG